jgi:hypothetical protein
MSWHRHRRRCRADDKAVAARWAGDLIPGFFVEEVKHEELSGEVGFLTSVTNAVNFKLRRKNNEYDVGCNSDRINNSQQLSILDGGEK